MPRLGVAAAASAASSEAEEWEIGGWSVLATLV
uniref:Uncharacterized protein n=1 Tax=Arundo donax TaxID=35708 RepID=A0A0A9GZE4_ARUDO